MKNGKKEKLEIKDLINRSNASGQTMLHFAVDKGRLDLVKVLIAHGAKNLPDNLGYPPLTFVLLSSNGFDPKLRKAMVQVILQSSENNINFVHRVCATPLHEAGTLDDIACAKILLAKGANPDIKDQNGKTALQWALEEDRVSSYREEFKKYVSYSVRKKTGEELTVKEIAEFSMLRTRFKHYHKLKQAIDENNELKKIKGEKDKENSNLSSQNITSLAIEKIPEVDLITAFVELNAIGLMFDYSNRIIREFEFLELIDSQFILINKLIEECEDQKTKAIASIILGYAYLGHFWDLVAMQVFNFENLFVMPKEALNSFKNALKNYSVIQDEKVKKIIHAYARSGLFIAECSTTHKFSFKPEYKKKNANNPNAVKLEKELYLNDHIIKDITEIYNKYIKSEDLDYLLSEHNKVVTKFEDNTEKPTYDSYSTLSVFISSSQVLNQLISLFYSVSKTISETMEKRNFEEALANFDHKDISDFNTYLTFLNKLLQHCKEITTEGEIVNEDKAVIATQAAKLDNETKDVDSKLAILVNQQKKFEALREKNFKHFLKDNEQTHSIRQRYFKAVKKDQIKTHQLKKEENIAQEKPKNTPAKIENKTSELEGKASVLYKEGKFKEASELYKMLLIEEVNSDNRLQSIQAKMGIADCLVALGNWSKYSVSQKEADDHLKKASEIYSEAIAHAKQGMEENNVGSQLYVEYESYHYFLVTSLNSLSDPEKQYLNDLQEDELEVTEEQNTDVPKAASKEITQPVEVKQKPRNKKNVSFLPQKFEIKLETQVKEFITCLNELGKAQTNNNEDCYVYIVGGAVRDALLNKTSADVDLVTKNIPFQKIKKYLQSLGILFKTLGTKTGPVIQIQLGNTKLDITPCCQKTQRQDKQQAISLDNGTLALYTPTRSIIKDAQRRDFTINAFYYDTVNQVIIDASGRGYKDLNQHRISTICEPQQSFTEDPVRILRGVYLRSKTLFQLAADTSSFIKEHLQLINQLTPRQYHLWLKKLFLYGTAKHSYQLLNELGLFQEIFPATKLLNEDFTYKKMVENFFTALDTQYELHGKLSLLLSVLLWWPIKKASDECKFTYTSNKFEHLNMKMDELLNKQQAKLKLPQFILNNVKEIWNSHIFGTQYLTSLDNYVSYLQFVKFENDANLKFATSHLNNLKRNSSKSHSQSENVENVGWAERSEAQQNQQP